MPRVHVLLADDDEHSRFLTARHLTRVLGTSAVTAVADGEQAIAYLCGEGEFADRQRHPFPTLMITDLKMPRADGFAVLDFLRHNPSWSVLPKIVFSSSADPDDIRTAYYLGASAFHQKPCGNDALRAAVDLMLTYWLSCEVPAVDVDGRLIATARAGKLGERYPIPTPGLTARMARLTAPTPARANA
jgi:CheY-like chemotaxis protein